MAPRTQKDLEDDIYKGIDILEAFTGRNPGTLIPKSILANAHGLIIIRVFRIGLMVSARSGTGIIIARNPDGSWSAPSGISLNGVGAGYQAGVESTSFVIVMNYRAAIKSFLQGGGQFELGVTASLAIGPYGRAAELSAGTNNGNYLAVTYSYSLSKGIYGGYSIGGAKLSERPNTNKAFYGRPISAKQILEGGEPRPLVARRLYEILDSICGGATTHFGSKSGTGTSISSQSNIEYIPPIDPGRSLGYPPANPPTRFDPAQNQSLFSEPPPPYEPRPNTGKDHGEWNSNNYTNDNKIHANNSPQSYPAISPAESSIGRNLSYGSSSSFNHANKNNEEYDPFNAHFINQNMANESNSTKGGRSVPPIPPSEPTFTVVTALYDYQGNPSTELSFSAGDTIIVTKRTEDRQSWWEGEIGDKRGSFPANYTEDLTN
ncbi:hypothetical protein CLU79DRAFT_764240 [Phycomyces nitens]|nr:hypothetical protein CLU79DRAFT_764240 [Phycomyces nitens]